MLLRLLQGLAVGGEWAGAVLLTAEHAPTHKRGAYAAFPQLGAAIAFVLTSLTFMATSLTLTTEQFMSFGWRIPFLASIVLVFIGLYVRLNISETPAFAAVTSRKSVARLPIAEVVRHQKREILLAGGSITMIFAFFYIGVTYLTAYGTGTLGLSRVSVLAIGIVAGIFFAATTVAGAVLSDRIGRRKVILAANVVAVPWALVLFRLFRKWSAGEGVSDRGSRVVSLH